MKSLLYFTSSEFLTHYYLAFVCLINNKVKTRALDGFSFQSKEYFHDKNIIHLDLEICIFYKEISMYIFYPFKPPPLTPSMNRRFDDSCGSYRIACQRTGKVAKRNSVFGFTSHVSGNPKSLQGHGNTSVSLCSADKTDFDFVKNHLTRQDQITAAEALDSGFQVGFHDVEGGDSCNAGELEVAITGEVSVASGVSKATALLSTDLEFGWFEIRSVGLFAELTHGLKAANAKGSSSFTRLVIDSERAAE